MVNQHYECRCCLRVLARSQKCHEILSQRENDCINEQQRMFKCMVWTEYTYAWKYYLNDWRQQIIWFPCIGFGTKKEVHSRCVPDHEILSSIYSTDCFWRMHIEPSIRRVVVAAVNNFSLDGHCKCISIFNKKIILKIFRYVWISVIRSESRQTLDSTKARIEKYICTSSFLYRRRAAGLTKIIKIEIESHAVDWKKSAIDIYGIL